MNGSNKLIRDKQTKNKPPEGTSKNSHPKEIARKTVTSRCFGIESGLYVQFLGLRCSAVCLLHACCSGSPLGPHLISVF